VPAIIDHIKISRVGLSGDKIKYELTGRLSFASFMWEKPFFSREQITENFDVSLRYLYAKEESYRDWTTDVVMNVDSLDVTLHRKQFIVLQSILDNQLADIRDVSATVFASLKQRKKTSSFLEVTYSRKWMCFFTRFCVVENKRQSNATF